MKKLFFKIFASFLIISSFALSSQSAEKYNLVLFYADWNVYSQQAVDTLSSIADANKLITFEKINVDDKKAFVRMKQLGVMPSNSIPYYFLIDKNKKVIYGSTYKNEAASDITKELERSINR